MNTKNKLPISTISTIGILLLVFVLILAYAFIKADIDEKKQQRLNALERKPLDDCLEYEERMLENARKTNVELWKFDSQRWLDENPECKVPTSCKAAKDARWEALSRMHDSSEQVAVEGKDECYRRYK